MAPRVPAVRPPREPSCRRAVLRGLVALALLLVPAAPAHAQQDSRCLTADPPAITQPAQPLRFGIFPLQAGSAGGEQGAVAAEDPERALAAVQRIQPPDRRLVARLNRLFMRDGDAGIERFTGIADRYAQAGFDVESQVRYQPAPQDEGNMERWTAYVRRAATALGRNPALVELSITNEVNLQASSNTSDGAYEGAIDAVVTGVVAAREALDAIGRTDVTLGFSFAYRYVPDSDAGFWRQIGTKASPAFRAALDHVGLQIYPGLFWPPVLTPGQTVGDATVEALTLLRSCWLPMAGLGPEVDLWITENGYATNLGHARERQAQEVTTTIADVHRYSGTLGVTDYRYFNLRDNDSDGADLFAAVGLLDDAYGEKPALAALRDAVAAHGAPPRARGCTVAVTLPGAKRTSYRRATADGVRVATRRTRRGVNKALVALPHNGTHAVVVKARTRRGRLVTVRRAALRCPA